MFPAKPTSRFILFACTILLLIKFTIVMTASTDPYPETGNDDDLDELLAIDEQEEGQDHPLQQGEVLKEAELVSKAQRIVLELNIDSAERVINDNEFVIVLGYAPWCARSAELMPQFAEAATKLKELGSGVLMTKIDGDRYPKVASRLGIKGFPTLILFVNGSSHAYTGGFTGDDIVLWARKKTGHPIVRLSSTAEAEDFLKKYSVFVLGLFEAFEGLDYEEFVKAATSDNEIQFIEVSDIRVAKILFPDIKTTKPFIGIVKGEPERYTEYAEGSFEKDKILEFLDYNKFPLVTRLTELNSGRVYASPIKLRVFVFAAADDLKSLLDILQEVARKFKSKIMFISVDIADENLAKPFLTMFGLEDSENTVVTAYDNKVLSKYLLESDPTPSYLEEFCSGLLRGSLSSYFKSQPIPDSKNTNASVLIIVGKTFDDLVLSSPKNVLLEVYTPWCIHCGTITKQVEKLAKHFKGLGSLVIARIDHSANEHPKLLVNDYPTLLFYPAEDKANPIKLSTKSSAKDLAVAINNHLKANEVTKDEL